MRAPVVIGWATGRSSGVAHLLVDRGDARAVAACGTTGSIGGQAHREVPDYARGVCRKCEAAAQSGRFLVVP